MKRSTAGFTLLELLIVILCSSIVTFAAMSFLLLGMRMSGESNDTAEQQQTARMILTLVENLSGQIKKVDQLGSDGWAITGTSGELLQHLTGGNTITSNGAVLIDGLEEAKAEMDGKLLRFTIKTQKATYETSVYCRTAEDVTPEGETDSEVQALLSFRAQISEAVAGNLSTLGESPAPAAQTPAPAPQTEHDSRLALLTVLAGQHGSTGEIKNQAADAPYRYFSEWYIHGYGADKPGWNADTPWCACFVSWAAAQLGDGCLAAVPYFCSVDDGMEQFQNRSIGTWHSKDYSPTPGDCIFFDWTGGNDPSHVGVVFYVDTSAGKVYTIEGNSGGRAAIRSYALDDPCILGYGELNWNQ